MDVVSLRGCVENVPSNDENTPNNNNNNNNNMHLWKEDIQKC